MISKNPQNFKNYDFPFVFGTNRPFEANVDFESHLGANLLPFCLRKSTKIGTKSDPQSNPSFDQFWLRFFTILIGFWMPT